jgi:hypothetical protein
MYSHHSPVGESRLAYLLLYFKFNVSRIKKCSRGIARSGVEVITTASYSGVLGSDLDQGTGYLQVLRGFPQYL